MSFKSPIIHTSSGFVKGSIKTTDTGNKYFSFCGIPYAKPPVGELRFKNPQPIEPWSAVFDATKEGPSCPTLNLLVEPFGFEGDESKGLALNIFTPSLQSKRLLPVFLWIHGGGFLVGSSTTMFYGPDYIIDKDVIMVSINYRLGVLGFLSLKDPAAGVPGNAGLKDQTMAMNWIKNNIQQFGGDSNNITIAGESAGGGSVHYHLISDMSKGLFQKAIPQSGCALNPWALAPMFPINWEHKLAQKLGYSGAADDDLEILTFLQKQTPEALVSQSFDLVDRDTQLESMYDFMSPFLPRIEPYVSDQCFIPTTPVEMGRNAWSSDVHVIIGGCSDEGYLFAGSIVEDRVSRMKDNSEFFLPYEIRVSRPIPDSRALGQAIRDLYFNGVEVSTEAREEFSRYYGDSTFWHGINRAIHQRVRSNGRGKTYLYRMSTGTSHATFFGAKVREFGKITHTNGATHGEELCFLFKTTVDKEKLNPNQSFFKTQQRFLGAFMKFVRDGEPSDSTFAPLKWTPVVRGHENHCLDMGQDEWKFIDYPDSNTLNVWNSVIPKDQLY